jgi:NAD-dependent SIR2 family protein deacetylase
MPEKILLVTGAGFSVPANIPIQNAIINEMILENNTKFLTRTSIPNSNKFFHSYIDAGLFLLSEYTNEAITEIRSEYGNLNRRFSERETLTNILNSLSREFSDQFDELENFINKLEIHSSESESYFDEISQFFNNYYKNIIQNLHSKYILDDLEYSKTLFLQKEQVRKLLKNHRHGIILEDIFTWFDKTLLTKEHGDRFTYQEMDKIKNSVLRLFVYYFCLCINNHDYRNDDYLKTIKFISMHKPNISVITTNWDTILENYLDRANIKFDLCLNNPYFSTDGKREKRRNKNDIKLIKVHGSVNWSKCLSCGSINIAYKKALDQFLFDDKAKEICTTCRKEAEFNNIQLQPEIITPTMMKSISNQLYNNLWREASYELAEADKIIFIGYSLPIADFELRFLLKKSIKPSIPIDVILYKTDDPRNIHPDNKPLEKYLASERYSDLFSQNQIYFYYDGFGEYFSRY